MPIIFAHQPVSVLEEVGLLVQIDGDYIEYSAHHHDWHNAMA